MTRLESKRSEERVRSNHTQQSNKPKPWLVFRTLKLTRVPINAVSLLFPPPYLFPTSIHLLTPISSFLLPRLIPLLCLNPSPDLCFSRRKSTIACDFTNIQPYFFARFSSALQFLGNFASWCGFWVLENNFGVLSIKFG